MARVTGVVAWWLLATIAMAMALSGCGAAPAPGGADDGTSANAQRDGEAGQDASAAARSTPSTPARRRVLVTPTPVDRSCQVDADCAVKDVGNCCGAYPACVSIDSPTDPAGVMAQCAQKGIAGTSCGIPVVTGCQCVDNVCGDIARDGEFLQ